MTTNQDPFLVTGISLGIPNNNATSIENIDNAIFLDESGNLHFKDSWVPTQNDVDGIPLQSISLRDLWLRTKGIYSKDGQLYFKDDVVKRAYSLSEIVSAYAETKSKFVNGGLWWIGRTSITNAECDNIKINPQGDPTLEPDTDGGRIFFKENDSYVSVSAGTEVFSIDRYLETTTFTDGDFKTNVDGSARWHDVPNLKLVIPAIDETKALMILSKLPIHMIGIDTPILFRLYDATTGETLDKVSMQSGSFEPSDHHVVLNYYGVIPSFKDKFKKLKCDCPTTAQLDNSNQEPPHVLKVQFYVNDKINTLPGEQNNVLDNITIQSYIENHVCCGNVYTETIERDIKYLSYERRVIGLPNNVSDESIVSTTIDCVIFDITQEDKVGRKAGNVEFSNMDKYEVVFSNPFSSSDYTVTISCNKNINTYYTSKKSTGFIIRSEKKFSGTVDWIATKLVTEGAA